MNDLICSVKQKLQEDFPRPYSIYHAVNEQKILNVPIHNPLLIFVLMGEKRLGSVGNAGCLAGEFVFLSNRSSVDMRNIPASEEYLSVLIEFDLDDFCILSNESTALPNYVTGSIDHSLGKTLQQFLEWSELVPEEVWHFRRKEILQLIYSQGYKGVTSLIEPPSFTWKVKKLIRKNISGNNSLDFLCSELAVSESTLRRKLDAEGSNLRLVKEQIKLGHGLHLIQTTMEPIGLIAERCGYHSQSRFTAKFKKMFGLTPSELRRTRVRIAMN